MSVFRSKENVQMTTLSGKNYGNGHALTINQILKSEHKMSKNDVK